MVSANYLYAKLKLCHLFIYFYLFVLRVYLKIVCCLLDTPQIWKFTLKLISRKMGKGLKYYWNTVVILYQKSKTRVYNTIEGFKKTGVFGIFRH